MIGVREEVGHSDASHLKLKELPKRRNSETIVSEQNVNISRKKRFEVNNCQLN